MSISKTVLAVVSVISLACAAMSVSRAQSASETEFFIQETLNQSPFYSRLEDYRFTFKVGDGFLEQHGSKLLLRVNFKDVGRFSLTTDEFDRNTLRSRCGLRTNPKYRNTLGGPKQESYMIRLACRNGDKCVEDYWTNRDKMIRRSSMDLYFCPTETGQRDVKRVQNAIGHYMELLGVRVNRLDKDSIGSQFD